MFRIIIVLLVFSFLHSFSQDSLNYAYVNEKTYNYYLEGNWKDLSKLGKKAIKSEIDYYYLRMRIGIALFEQGNFLWAEKHFKKALKFNSGDTLSHYYLYEIFRNTGNNKTAGLLSKKLTSHQKSYLKIPENLPFVNGFEAELNVFQNPNYNSQTEVNLESFPVYITKTVINNFTNGFVYLNHPLGKRVSYSHGYTYLFLNGLELFRPPIFPEFTPPEGYLTNKQEITQNQYYGKLSIQIFKRGELGLGAHFVSSKIVNFRGKEGPPNNSAIKEKNIIKFLCYKHGFSDFVLHGFVSSSNINLNIQKQLSLGITWYPFGNLNQYLLGEISKINENKSNLRQVLRFKAGSKIFGSLWLEATHSRGEIKNYLESDGFFVFNNLNTILAKTEISLILFRPKNNIQYYLKYSLNNNRGDNIYGKLEENAPINVDPLNQELFNTNIVTGGIKWDF